MNQRGELKVDKLNAEKNQEKIRLVEHRSNMQVEDCRSQALRFLFQLQQEKQDLQKEKDKWKDKFDTEKKMYDEMIVEKEEKVLVMDLAF